MSGGLGTWQAKTAMPAHDISGVINRSLMPANNRKKTLVYPIVNGDHALFHASKTAKMIKVILLRAPCQNVNVLLSNITFIIFAVFDA